MTHNGRFEPHDLRNSNSKAQVKPPVEEMGEVKKTNSKSKMNNELQF